MADSPCDDSKRDHRSRRRCPAGSALCTRTGRRITGARERNTISARASRTCALWISCMGREKARQRIALGTHLKSKSVRAVSAGADCAGRGASLAAVAPSEADLEPYRLRKKSMARVTGDRTAAARYREGENGGSEQKGRPRVCLTVCEFARRRGEDDSVGNRSLETREGSLRESLSGCPHVF